MSVAPTPEPTKAPIAPTDEPEPTDDPTEASVAKPTKRTTRSQILSDDDK